MTTQKLNKHELKTKETRELLLQAAEKIFVRDGYEAAELGEIAALAGRTKGAIYAQFKSKEDIFLALVEYRASRHRSQTVELRSASLGAEESRKALREFYLKLTEDRSWALLLLEFKLFAMRHPEAKARLQAFYDSVISIKQEKQYSQILGSAGTGKNALSRFVAIRMLDPLISALAVEAEFDPELQKDDTRKKVLGRIFDSLLQSPPPKSSR
jgi:AcrR family transcriptional regulator